MNPFPFAPVDATFQAMAVTFVPELAAAEPEVWDRLRATIRQALESRSAGVGGRDSRGDRSVT